MVIFCNQSLWWVVSWKNGEEVWALQLHLHLQAWWWCKVAQHTWLLLPRSPHTRFSQCSRVPVSIAGCRHCRISHCLASLQAEHLLQRWRWFHRLIAFKATFESEKIANPAVGAENSCLVIQNPSASLIARNLLVSLKQLGPCWFYAYIFLHLEKGRGCQHLLYWEICLMSRPYKQLPNYLGRTSQSFPGLFV